MARRWENGERKAMEQRIKREGRQELRKLGREEHEAEREPSQGDIDFIDLQGSLRHALFSKHSPLSYVQRESPSASFLPSFLPFLSLSSFPSLFLALLFLLSLLESFHPYPFASFSPAFLSLRLSFFFASHFSLDSLLPFFYYQLPYPLPFPPCPLYSFHFFSFPFVTLFLPFIFPFFFISYRLSSSNSRIALLLVLCLPFFPSRTRHRFSSFFFFPLYFPFLPFHLSFPSIRYQLLYSDLYFPFSFAILLPAFNSFIFFSPLMFSLSL